MADSTESVSASITAEDTFTDWLILGQHYSPGHAVLYPFTVLVQGTFVATVTTQYKRPTDADSDAVDDTVTIENPSLHVGEITGAWYVRAGVKTGDFTSGTVEIQVSRT